MSLKKLRVLGIPKGLMVLCLVVLAMAIMGRTYNAQQTITNGSAQGLLPAFLFELELPLMSLKTMPVWDELEQLLDNPYATTTACTDAQGAIPTNAQGIGASTCATIARRPSFGGVTLPPLVMHPLNYHPAIGGEMRLLNPAYPGGEWQVPAQVIQDPSTGVWNWTYQTVQVSSGASRLVEVDPQTGEAEIESVIDHNAAVAPESIKCIVTAESNPPEGSTVCGADTGEPPGYSVAGVQGGMLVRADGSPIFARDPVTGEGGLEKPSLRLPDHGGTPTNPNYWINTDPANVIASSENDYVRNRQVAMELGKALFWDMQVGSDGVQSCGSCHFHAGADNRTKNQMNPNHLSGDVNFEIKQPNQELAATDFPFIKLADPDISGDPACNPPIRFTINPGVLENRLPNGGTRTVCSAANAVSRSNDVASSMGVKFGKFKDIVLGVVPNSTGVPVVRPDLRADSVVNPATGQLVNPNIDPIPGFAGNLPQTDPNFGHQFRRVEPRNTPTFFLSAVNFDNFWDGRARHDFNGGSVFGPADPQSHVYAHRAGGIVATRQIIRFASLASLAPGPGLSEFEMSYLGRNWAKIAKKLLQPGTTPLANQLVAPNDSILGRWSNNRATPSPACANLPVSDRSGAWPPAVGKPGLCISYNGLIERAFYPALHRASVTLNQHLNGCYTDGDTTLHPNQCAPGVVDPFDGFVLSIAPGAADPANTNHFTLMEANFPVFWGLAIHLWGTILVPDNTPYDQFLDANPDMFASLGEPGEPGLVSDFPMCTSPGQRNCLTEVGRFRRDVALGGTRTGGRDPLLGFDIFGGTNLSLKNPNFRTGRCAECHAGPTLTDHTMQITNQIQLLDMVAEFVVPGVELALEPIGRPRVISGFLLESEINENGQDAVERRIINQSIAPNQVDGLAWPDGITNDGGSWQMNDLLGSPFTNAGSAYFDNGVYNLGVTRCDAEIDATIDSIGRCDDPGRGGNDAFGWPLSLAALMLKNYGGDDGEVCDNAEGCDTEPGEPLATFECAVPGNCDLIVDQLGGLFEDSAQDQQINPGAETDDVEEPLLPAYLAPWASNMPAGELHPDYDEVSFGLNTLTDVPTLEGFLDALGPFNPAGVINESFNSGNNAMEGTWPVVNRVGRMGSFKAAQLREVELTGPYFHNGGKLTLRQVVDFYGRGGDFPVSNAGHRDFNIVNLNFEVQSNLTEAEKVALVDFLLELTDTRVEFERAPFDHPEIFVPLDGTAQESGELNVQGGTIVAGIDAVGRNGFLANVANGMFRQVRAVGANGRGPLDPADPANTGPLPSFLGLSTQRLAGAAAEPGSAACPSTGVTSHYCR